ncbi:MAG: hypothetical protein HYT48_02185 [Candidatus Vogelbacteria bacterium]|nr:hypothetical protein [Candidatus Vogelbacteria bacterium]
MRMPNWINRLVGKYRSWKVTRATVTTTPTSKTEEEYELVGKGLFPITVTILYLLFTLVFMVLGGKRIELWGMGLPLNWAWLGLVIGYTLASFTNTGLSERALKLLLGMPIQEIPPGRLVFIPRGFYWLEPVPIKIREMELPGEPEQIWRFKDEQDKELPLGIGRDGKPVLLPTKDGKPLPWIQPIRVNFDDENSHPDKDPLNEIANDLENKPAFRKTPGTPKEVDGVVNEEERGEDPTSKRVTTEVSGILQWRVWHLATFLRSFETFKNAEKQLADIAVSAMSSALQMGTLGRALGNQELLGHYITQKVREKMGHEVAFEKKAGHPKGETISCRRGVEIISFQLKPPGLSYDLNVAIQRILEAKAKAAATIREAEGDNKRMELLDLWADKPGGKVMLDLERLRTIRESIGRKDDKIILVDGKDPLAGLFGAIIGAKILPGTPLDSTKPSW